MITAEDHWRTSWIRGGRISEVAWINQDTLAWCSGIHLVFFDVSTNKLLLPRFSYDIVALGASCLSGHPSQQIFAFAEKHLKPRIFVYTYPSMIRVCECVKGTRYAYLATTFTGDCLVSLSSIPEFKLTFWLWRTGERITSVDTSVYDAKNYGQTLKANFSMPTFIVQGSGGSGKFFTWEVMLCNKTINLQKYKVVLPMKALAQDVAWCPDLNDILAIVDRNGNIYLSNSNGSEIKCIVPSQHSAIHSEVEPAKICWYRGGIVLRATFCQIDYYQQHDDNLWSKTWMTKCINSPSVLTSHPLRNDRLFFITVDGHIIQINYSTNDLEATQEVKRFLRGKYLFVDFLKPWEEYVIAIDVSMDLSVIEVDKGSEVAKFNLNIMGKITTMMPHPRYPVIAVSSDKGEVVFVSFLSHRNPKILGRYRLQLETLDIMKFSSSGRYLIACQKNTGICYLFNVSASNSIEIRTRLDAKFKIVDIMLFELENSLKLYVLEESSTIFSIGNKLVPFELLNNQGSFKRSLQTFTFINYYQRLYNISDESNLFVGSPYLTKQLRFFKINDTKDIIITDIKPNGHKIRQVKLFCNNKWLITCGIDGLVTVRSANVESNKNEYLISHHRHEFSVVKAAINSAGNVLVTLCVDGSIVAIKYFQNESERPTDHLMKNFYEFAHMDLEYYKNEATKYNMFTKEEIEFLSNRIRTYLDSEESELTWVEWKKKQKLDEEKNQSQAEKDKIVSKLTNLKSKIINLLNENETFSEFKKLPMSAFALNKIDREKNLKSAKDEREEVRRELKLNCHEMERVINWIQTKFWNTQKVLGQSIFGIFDQTEVTNYTISVEEYRKPDLFKHAQFMHNVFKEFMDVETIYPWDIFTPSQLNLKFNKQIRIRKTDEIGKIGAILDNPDEPEVEEEFYEYSLEGLTTYLYIQPCAPAYSQYKTYSFIQHLCNDHHFIEDCNELRFFFNKRFDDMHLIKEREMNLIRERVDRVQHISSELKLMFNVIVDDQIIFPEWNIKEKPKTIIQALESEMSTKPYISPSVQELFDKQAADELNARLAMMADDFRERAVQTMMDGVLEVRWEDLIKKDAPQPTCMVLGKKPEDYTDEDNLAVKRYEQSVKDLELQREKYRMILQNDYAKINSSLKKGIKKFNSQLEELHLLKMKVEAAIQQLHLQYVRGYKGHFDLIHYVKEVNKMKKEVAKKYQFLSKLSEEISRFEKVDEELSNRYDNLNMKDKYLERKFKSDFPTLGKVAVGVLFTHYKKRPRIALKNATPFELLDLGKSIISMKNIPYLTIECLDYLKQLAILDIRPTNLPGSIEVSHWQNLVAVRRLKIDHELKLRASKIDLERSTEVLRTCSEKVKEQKLDIKSIKEQLKHLRSERIELELDTEVQLVVKMGQAEVEQLHGDLKNDMVGAIVVPRADVQKVNDAISATGKSKLTAIRRNLDFRREIEEKQWMHDCLKTKIQHHEVSLYFAKTAVLTREIRDFLMRKSKGWKDDKTPQKMKRGLEAMRKSQMKIVKDYDSKLKLIYEEILQVQKKNEKLDEKITRMNIDRCELELQRDVEGEVRHKDFRQKIIELAAQRSALVRKLLKNYEELLEIQKKREILSCAQHPSIRYVPKYLEDEIE